MIDQIFWKMGICDLCRKNDSLLKPMLVGIRESGNWVGGYSVEKAIKVKDIYSQWHKMIECPCIVIYAEMEKVTICEKHLAEVIAKKDEFIKIENNIANP